MGDDESSGSELRSLNELFDRGFNLYLEIEKSTESANEKSYQDKVREAATQFENATHLVNEAGLFSENEEIDEVATHHLKFLLLPALLGSLTQKKVAVDRSEILRLSEVYFRDFLRRCRQYGVTSYELPETKDDDVPDEKAAAATKKSETDSLLDACRKRKEKIARFTEQKAMEERQRQLKDLISSPTVDDEVLREYYNVLLKYWVNNSIEELRSIEEEKPILQYMAKVKAQGKPTHEASTQQQPKKLEPARLGGGPRESVAGTGGGRSPEGAAHRCRRPGGPRVQAGHGRLERRKPKRKWQQKKHGLKIKDFFFS
ncbi:immunoglobulin-binding protein 1b isoform X2 [Dermacentor silvarum]|uniref:immunoglobulin-binding protein 1b isoform X2 n=1 Tax=Dermacentor silvarum TaxID=543639 RepID=UPI0021006BBB|nr:immunoglobulin-binding protein 1b isoform X2 [Dermacentor silvarum]